MVKFVSGALMAGFVSLALVGTAAAQPAEPDVNAAEFKCMASQSKAAGKFVGAKAKCVSKCLQNFWKGAGVEADCLPPYGGTTFECIVTNPLKPGKSAEEKYAAAIKKACDPATKPGTDCPECFDANSDCGDSGYATNQVQNIENQVDSFVPGVACERAGADKFEQTCQLNTAKVLSKHVASINKCYDKCYSNARKGTVTFGSCAPSATDPATDACLDKANLKAIAGVDKKCSQVVPSADPDCPTPDTYPDGNAWVNLVNLAIEGNVPANYCASPSGAFIE
jgi:hypothetical protein